MRVTSSLLMLVVGCGQVDEAGAPDEAPTLVRLAGVAAPADCARGGSTFEYGRDVDGDGVLAAAEVAGTFVVCDVGGEVDGGDAVVEARRLAMGAACSRGGVAIASGADDGGGGGVAGDGVLQPGEIDAVRYLCDGQDRPLEAGALFTVTPLPTSRTAVLGFSEPLRARGNIELAAAAGADLELIASDALGSLDDNGSAFTTYDFGGYNGAILAVSDSSTPYYTLRTAGGEAIDWRSLQLVDHAGWNTATVTFYAFAGGAQLAAEVHHGDVPTGIFGPVTHRFADPAFARADMIVIAPRSPDPTLVTPVALDNVTLSLPGECPQGGVELAIGLDDGGEGGGAGDGVLQPAEVDVSAVVCNAGGAPE